MENMIDGSRNIHMNINTFLFLMKLGLSPRYDFIGSHKYSIFSSMIYVPYLFIRKIDPSCSQNIETFSFEFLFALLQKR